MQQHISCLFLVFSCLYQLTYMLCTAAKPETAILFNPYLFIVPKYRAYCYCFKRKYLCELSIIKTTLVTVTLKMSASSQLCNSLSEQSHFPSWNGVSNRLKPINWLVANLTLIKTSVWHGGCNWMGNISHFKSCQKKKAGQITMHWPTIVFNLLRQFLNLIDFEIGTIS